MRIAHTRDATAAMQHDQQPPTRADVEAAAERIAPYLARTPLRSYPPLDRLLDARCG